MLSRNIIKFNSNEVTKLKMEKMMLLNEVKNAVVLQESAVERMVTKCRSIFKLVMPVVDSSDGMEVKWIGIK